MPLENFIAYPVLFNQVRILNEDSLLTGSETFADVFVDRDRQIHVNFDSSQIPEDTNIYERSGVVLGTGAVDLYSTSSEPGHESRETIVELIQAAKNGGFATVGVLPNTQPAIDDIAALEFWRNVRQKHGDILQPWGAITKGLKGEQLTDSAELAESVIGFTDGKAIANLLSGRAGQMAMAKLLSKSKIA